MATVTKTESDFYTVKEVAGKLSLHYLTVLKLLKTNKLQGIRFGNSWRVKKTYLDNLDASTLKET